jgi:hypothetical protein
LREILQLNKTEEAENPGKRVGDEFSNKVNIMTTIKETTLNPVTKAGSIFTLQNISEQSGINGFAFSKRMLAKTGMKTSDFTGKYFEGKAAFKHKAAVNKMASDSPGGPTISTNTISISIDNTSSTTGSAASYIYMYFGSSKRVKLNASSGFPAGDTLTWDLNDISDWLEDNVETDLWDEIGLVTESQDGFKIKNVKIVHSSETILDWAAGLWLDGSTNEEYTKIVLTGKILETKLSKIANLWVPQIHWAAREIGKTDSEKYGTTEAWCSEFSSWCLRKALWDTPEGNIGSQAMEDYFFGIGRKVTLDQVMKGEYKLVAGDYIRFEWSSGGQHSAIFMEYLSDSSKPSDTTSIKTIEGNTSSTVGVRTRSFADLLSVGNCQ